MRNIVLISLPLLVARLAAQSSRIDCMALDHGTQWPFRAGSASGPKAAPSRRGLITLMTGHYRLDLVTTEGVDTPTVTHWRIAIVAADTLSKSFPMLVLRQPPPLVGTRTDLPQPTPFDSIRIGRFLGGMADFEMVLDSTTGDLTWFTAPGTLDAGWFFSVGEVDSTHFAGRWVDGGLAVAILRRRNLTVAEHLRGYYCAVREG